MSCKANSSSKPIKFQPMPMATLIANLKTLPAALNHRESSDSSDDSISPADKVTKKPVPVRALKRTPIPQNANSVSNKENNVRDRSYFDRVHVMPTIEASSTTSQAIVVDAAPKRAPVLEKKESARCLFPVKIPEQNEPKQTSTIYVDSKSGAPKEVPSESGHSTRDLGLFPDPIKELPKNTKTPVALNLGPPKEVPSEPSCSKTIHLHTPTVSATPSATPSQPRGKTAKVKFKTVAVKAKKYMVVKKLGTGGSSEVFKVLEISSLNEFALKCVDLPSDREMAQGYLNEVKVLRDLQKSDRVVKLYDYEYDKSNKNLKLVLEAGETDLGCFLRSHKDGAPPAQVLHYWEEMLRAVRQIHDHGIVHADLKPANFLLVSGTLKLIDFGIASAVSSDATSVVRTCGKGTFSYISPEALGGDGSQPIKVSFYSDVWSLGCILYSLVYGRTPFAHLSTMVKLATIRDPKHYIGYPPAENIPSSLIAALKQCLRYNGHCRPRVAELLQINYMAPNTRSIPDALLAKIQPHLTPLEFSVLQEAQLISTEAETT